MLDHYCHSVRECSAARLQVCDGMMIDGLDESASPDRSIPDQILGRPLRVGDVILPRASAWVFVPRAAEKERKGKTRTAG